MSQEIVPLTDEEKRVELEACELRIFAAFRRGVEASCDIGKELRSIEAQQLYDVRGYNNLLGYAKRELRMSDAFAARCLNTLSIIEQLELAGVALPSNESQIVELARLPEERVVVVWTRLIEACERKDVPITTKRVKTAVDLDEEDQSEPKAGAKKGVKVNVKFTEESEPLSEAAERALARIRRVCGQEVAEAIHSGLRPLPERALIRWAELQDGEMKELVYYVIDQGWSVAEAINYESKQIGGHFTLDDVVLKARARGGHLAIQHEEFLFAVDRVEGDAAA